jgi:hypothetical protein
MQMPRACKLQNVTARFAFFSEKRTPCLPIHLHQFPSLGRPGGEGNSVQLNVRWLRSKVVFTVAPPWAFRQKKYQAGES